MRKIENFSTKKCFQIKLGAEFERDEDEYRTTNADELLVLPSQKRATRIKKTETVTRILSRKQRKRLEKIVEKKKKKENVSFLMPVLRVVITDTFKSF